MNAIPLNQIIRVRDVYGNYHNIDRQQYHNQKVNILKRYNKKGEQLGKKVGKNCWKPSLGLHRDNIAHQTCA